MTRSFAGRLFLGMLLLLAMTAIVPSLIVSRQTERWAQIDTRSDLENQALVLSSLVLPEVLESAGDDLEVSLQRIVDEAASSQESLDALVVDLEGRVLVASEPSLVDESWSVRLDGREGDDSFVRRRGLSIGDSWMFSRPIVSDGPSSETLGQVIVLRSSAEVDTSARSRRDALLVWIWGSVAVGGFFAAALAYVVTRPLSSLRRSAKAIAKGDVSRPVSVRSGDDIGDLADSFNVARERLSEQLQTMGADRNRLNAVLSSMAEGVLAVDPTERVVHVNEVASEQLGLVGVSGDDLVGRQLHEITRFSELMTAVSRTLEEETEVSMTVRSGDRATDRVLEISSAPLRGADGAEGAVVVLHDTTQLHQLEGIRRDFVSNVSHELKTPLTTIRGFVETLLDAGSEIDLETRERFLRKIGVQSNRLTALVGDLLSLSRIESEESAGELEPIDLRAPLLDCLRTLRGSAEEKAVALQAVYPEVPVVVQGENESLRQAFANLVDNAIKYSSEGDQVTVRLLAKDNLVLFEAEDQGPGIEAEHLGRIFERFYRADKARSRELGGTGLGLSIVKNVAIRLGGTVEVESQPGEGSIFRMMFPLKDPGDLPGVGGSGAGEPALAEASGRVGTAS